MRADYVTVSWIWFRGTDKSMLIGHSDGNASEDTGHPKVCIHHNFFDGWVQRHLRVRFGEPVHVYNNYYLATSSYGVATTMNAGCWWRATTSRPCPTRPGRVHRKRPGRVVQHNNIFVGSGTPRTAGTVVEPRTHYQYTVDNPATVPATVRTGIGIGIGKI